MKNEEHSLRTKHALAHALQTKMKKKPLSRISVNDLVKECDINRNTFYYHFSDIYDLLNWLLKQDIDNVVKKIGLLTNTEEAIRFIMQYIENNQHIINCTHQSFGMEAIEAFIKKGYTDAVHNSIETKAQELNLNINSDFLDFLGNFYTEALCGLTIYWIKNCESINKETAIQNILFMYHTALPATLIQAEKKQTESL